METKQITLRSQTTQCPHCGEYYSVTYKYCPFCDAGRKEEERKQAEKKKQRQARLGSLLGGGEPEKKKKKRPAGAAAAPKQERAHREAPAERPAREHAHREAPAERPAREHAEREHVAKEPVKKAPAKKKESLFFKKETRKKTSELTEEEKKARLAEREARAAARKRLRDQAAREAALAASAAEAAGPVFEEDTVPETFGYTEDSEAPVDPAAYAQTAVSAEGPVVVDESDLPALEDIPVFPPEAAQEETEVSAQEEAPVQEPVEEETDSSRWEILRELESVPAAPVVEVAGATPETSEPANLQPEVQAASPVEAVPVAEPAPAAPVQAVSQEKPAVETEEDLDALLSEIRDMLADSPVPRLNPEELKKPVPPVAQTEIPQTVLTEGGAYLAAEPEAPVQEPAPVVEPVPAAEPAPAVEPTPVVESAPVVEETEPAPAEDPVPVAEPVVEEPTIVLPNLEDLSVETAPVQEALASDVAVDDQPTQILPHIQEEPAQEPAPTAVSAPVQEKKHAAKAEAKKAKKKKKSKALPVVLSLIIVAVAAVIVVKQVLPTFQDGLFSQGQSQEEGGEVKNTAETLTLDQTDVSTSEKGKTVTLIATLAPEGSTGTVTWATSDEAIATVDQNGVVTAVAPGEATITATLENGASAQCVVRCTWTDDTSQPSEDVLLSSTNITLDGEGKTKQLQVTGATGAVKWFSNKTDVATVSEDGTVTAVAKGGAVITAEVDGKTLTCEVKCIW